MAHQRARLQRATVEIVAAGGYEALTVRGLAKRARISSGAFYSLYRGTDDCFLSTYDMIWRCASERSMVAGANERRRSQSLAAAIERLFDDVTAAPQAAAFVFRAAPAAGPAFTSRLRGSEMQYGAVLDFCLRTDGGLQLFPQLLDGVLAGLTRIARVRLLRDEEAEAGRLATETAEWIKSLCVVADDGTAIPLLREKRAQPGSPSSMDGEPERGMPGDERTMILRAAFRVAKRGYHELSIPRICREAGIGRRQFSRHFKDLEECFLSALEDRVSSAVLPYAGEELPLGSWTEAVFTSLGTLCRAIERDRDSARVVLVDTSAAGTAGIESYDRQICQIVRMLRLAAPEGYKPSYLAAEASTAAALTVLARRLWGQTSAPPTELLSTLALLMFAPTLGGPAARLETRRVSKKRNRQWLDSL